MNARCCQTLNPQTQPADHTKKKGKTGKTHTLQYTHPRRLMLTRTHTELTHTRTHTIHILQSRATGPPLALEPLPHSCASAPASAPAPPLAPRRLAMRPRRSRLAARCALTRGLLLRAAPDRTWPNSRLVFFTSDVAVLSPLAFATACSRKREKDRERESGRTTTKLSHTQVCDVEETSRCGRGENRPSGHGTETTHKCKGTPGQDKTMNTCMVRQRTHAHTHTHAPSQHATAGSLPSTVRSLVAAASIDSWCAPSTPS